MPFRHGWFEPIFELAGQGSVANQRENIFRVFLQSSLDSHFDSKLYSRLSQAHKDQSDINKARTLKNIFNYLAGCKDHYNYNRALELYKDAVVAAKDPNKYAAKYIRDSLNKGMIEAEPKGIGYVHTGFKLSPFVCAVGIYGQLLPTKLISLFGWNSRGDNVREKFNSLFDTTVMGDQLQAVPVSYGDKDLDGLLPHQMPEQVDMDSEDEASPKFINLHENIIELLEAYVKYISDYLDTLQVPPQPYPNPVTVVIPEGTQPEESYNFSSAFGHIIATKFSDEEIRDEQGVKRTIRTIVDWLPRQFQDAWREMIKSYNDTRDYSLNFETINKQMMALAAAAEPGPSLPPPIFDEDGSEPYRKRMREGTVPLSDRGSDEEGGSRGGGSKKRKTKGKAKKAKKAKNKKAKTKKAKKYTRRN